jgi:hypothetical protein
VTATQTAALDHAWISTLPTARLWRALAFAIWAELAAAASLGASALAIGLVLSPRFSLTYLRVDRTWLWMAALVAAFAALMVFLHLLWGLSLSVCLRRAAHSGGLKQSVAFGLYACGWDLLTSPLGALVALITTGGKSALATVQAGARAPRPALSAYLRGQRQLDSTSARRVALASLIIPVLFATAVVIGLTVYAVLKLLT